MATSTFYDQITIDQQAAEIIAEGLRGPIPPRPEGDAYEDLRRGEEWLRQYESTDFLESYYIKNSVKFSLFTVQNELLA
jgi:hypothetical protein